MLLTIAAFAVVAGVIITIHEFGHFLAARLTGMRVKRFSIGFPPKMFSKKIGETEFSLSWIPLGGFVQIAGMVDESLEDNAITGAPDEFMSKNALQKTFVLCAGVIMNYITAFLLITGLVLVVGIAEVKDSKIGEVIPKNPAEAAGIRKGDQIVGVNGVQTDSWEGVVRAISSSSDTVALDVTRSESHERLEVLVPTKLIDDGKGGQRRVIGIVPDVTFRAAGAGEAVTQAYEFCYGTTSDIASFLKNLATGHASLSQLSGPVGVAKLSGESARQGPGAFLFFIAFVSVSIGFLNLLPFPVLDGGHVVYVLIEAITRKPIPSKVKLAIQQVGMVLLFVLILIVSYHDIVRIFAN
jgi:regulator of sigma E protease